ncbi:vitamin B6 photo-protection and homoeostasis-domain-containing protein, partial [Entophlyctis helioformis]
MLQSRLFKLHLPRSPWGGSFGRGHSRHWDARPFATSPVHGSSSSPQQRPAEPSLVLSQRSKVGQTTYQTRVLVQTANRTAQATGQPGGWLVEKLHLRDGECSRGASLASVLSAPNAAKSSVAGSVQFTAVETVKWVYKHARDSTLSVFFPRDMAASVTRDYLPYTLWHLVNSVTGTIAGTLSTQALLQALGLGAGVAIGLAATTNWIIKDGFGLLGGVLFAGFMGNRFDASPKYYRFLANLCIQAANLMELMTPMVPHLFIPIASLSNIGKNIGWLAASATRASMHRGFTRRDNLGDITAKAGAQATAAGLVGTGGGILLSWVVGTEPLTLLAAFLPLSMLNLWAAYQSNRSVVTRNMNVERAELSIRAYLDSAGKHAPSPEAIGLQETMIGRRKRPFQVALHLETPIEKSALFTEQQQQQQTNSQPPAAQQFAMGYGEFGHRAYRLYVSNNGESVWLWFLPHATPHEVSAGFVHACLVRLALERGDVQARGDGWISGTPLSRLAGSAGDIGLDAALDAAVRALADVGWDIEHTHLGDANRRLEI